MNQRPNPRSSPQKSFQEYVTQAGLAILASIPLLLRNPKVLSKILSLFGVAGLAMKGCQMLMQVDKKLIGLWRVESSIARETGEVFFQPDQKAIWIRSQPGSIGRPLGYVVPYTLDTSKIPMELKMQFTSSVTASRNLNILFTLTPDGQQLIGTLGTPEQNSGQMDALVLQKVPNVKTLPTNIRIVLPGVDSQSQRDYTGRDLMIQIGNLVESEISTSGRYLENPKAQRYGIRSRFRSNSYNVGVASISVEGRKVTFVAQGNAPGLKSYAGTTFVNAQGQTDTVFCETTQPSNQPPYIAGFPISSVETFNCPAGSVKF
ncbi:type IV pilin-like G/H family protein [Alkalinema sp. FACHB-956]|uniref:type IV pilin-like G/H family protein n=1 Tax=Alkalinema sp. FACHB-956 TaxID=2692768 RepID=UPI0016876DA6|nr:type IV pilin-like G/H family protein [Alkalinema sp. FACHB-956]MBD2328908.1 hypothetical protein [Alkalinema sp. FACHB-956]